jgi:cytochrome P450
MTATATDEVPFFNILDPEFDFESEEVAQAREQSWYARTPIGLLVLRYAEGSQVMRDRRFRLGGEHAMDNLGLTEGPFYDFWMEGMFAASAADHARLRGLLNKTFAPATVERLRPFARAIADGLVARIEPGQECEFVAAFAEYPEQWTLLGERPELAPQAVEEICRWSPQARSPFRYSMEDVELHGLEIPKGTMVMISTVAANRDPRVFDEPDTFDITASQRQRSLTFGGGMHHCLGEAHARMEMSEGLRALTARLGPPSITGPITWRTPMSIIHGPEVLPLQFAERG